MVSHFAKSKTHNFKLYAWDWQEVARESIGFYSNQ